MNKVDILKRGSIELARRLCYDIAGPTDEDDDISGSDYGSVDIAEILSAEVVRLRAAIKKWVDARNAPITGLFGTAQLEELRKAESELEQLIAIDTE